MGEKLTKTAEIIEHKGVQILFNDFKGLQGQQLADALKEIARAMRPRIGSRKDWLSVNDYTGCMFDEAATKALIRVQKGMTGFFLAIAEVGLSPIQRSSIELMHSLAKSDTPMSFPATVEEAKDWVVSVHREQTRKKP
jgi:hypothetical protein